MGAEKIVPSRKDGRLPGKKPASPLAFPKQKSAQIPANPIGEQELSDEDLELVEGGTRVSSTEQCAPPPTE